jgi:hypothetical protein
VSPSSSVCRAIGLSFTKVPLVLFRSSST